MNELILNENEREFLGRLASSCAPSEWAISHHAGEILKCIDKGVLPSPEAIQWFLTHFRKQAC